MVIGVEIEGDARAYPLRILNLHEMVNDRLAGQPIAVIYCALRRSELVFSRSVGGETLTFGVSGQLLEANLMLYDRQTETYWSQMEARPSSGRPSPRASHSIRARSRRGASGARAILTPRCFLGTSASTPKQPPARTCTTTTRTAAGLASAWDRLTIGWTRKRWSTASRWVAPRWPIRARNQSGSRHQRRNRRRPDRDR